MLGERKREIRWVIDLILVILYLAALPAQAKYGGGSGEPNDPYLIYTAEQMNAIGLYEEDWDKHFRLLADIDMSNFDGKEDRPVFNIIAPDTDSTHWQVEGIPFAGVFDGNGHKISNFTYSSTDTDCIGLFGHVYGKNAEVKDLGLIDPNIDAGTGDYVGSLVGCLIDGTITACYVEGGIVSGDEDVGGLVGAYGEEPGYLEPPFTISNCYSTSSVQGTMCVGGLVGSNYKGLITNCYATGSVLGMMNVGGLVGQNGRRSMIYNRSPTPGTIISCYSTGLVSGQSNVGGLVGLYIEGPVIGCFWDIETSGQLTSTGGRGRTTVQMHMSDTFIGWDGCWSEGIWTIDDGNDYPRLWWENKPGKPLEGQLFDFLQGAGTEDDPFLIYTAEQINIIGVFPCEWDKYFLLMEDIDLGRYRGTDFNVIGTWRDAAFTGVFDGNGKKISNFSYTSSDTNRIGFFGCVSGKNALIKDLELTNAEVDAGTGNLVGSLVGYLEDGIIARCYVKGCIVLGNDNVGGLVGYNGGVVTDCCSIGEVNGNEHIGGIVGFNFGDVNQCYSISVVSGSVDVGGLVGLNARSVTLCYSTGIISGDEIVGGLVGRNGYWIPENAVTYGGNVTNSYSTGAVHGNNSVGGLVGLNEGGMVDTSFWDIQASGQVTSAGGIGKTTAEMQMSFTFIDWGGCCSKSKGVWTIDEGKDYPRLWWEYAPGHVIESTQQCVMHAANPSPPDGALQEDTWVNLSWLPRDCAVSHRVYFGDNFKDVNDGTSDTFQGNQDTTIFTIGLPGFAYPDGLELSTTYYWRIDEVNNIHPESPCKGDVWSFTVPRRIAFNPSLPDGAIHEDTIVNLSWKPGDYAVSHDVYFSDNYNDVNRGSKGTFIGNQAGTFLVVGLPGSAYPDGLVPGTTYYWRIDDVNDMNPESPWKGNIWSFTITPYTAYNPTPPDGAKFVDPNISLSWRAGLGAKLHTIYFGDDFDTIKNAVGNLPQENAIFDPGLLISNKTYYWRVDEYDGVSMHKGDVWNFTVPHKIAYDPSPPDGAIHDGTWVGLSWLPGGYAVSHKVYFGDNFDDVNDGTGGTFRGNHTSTSYVVGLPGSAYPDSLEPYTTYYWRIDEVNNIHPENPSKGEVWSFTVSHRIAFNPSPPDGAIHEDTWVSLEWLPGEYTVSHNVYMGENFDDVNDGAESAFIGNQADTFLVAGFPGFAYPDGLVPGTTYYWRIDEVNKMDPNSPWKGDVWSFSIPPKIAYNPDPSDGAESVELDADLSWTPGFGAKLHIVYIGDNFDDVNNADGGLLQGNVTYDPWTLELAKTYYWRVDEFDIIETHKGNIWSFTTEGAIGNPNPANGAVDITQTPILTWTHGIYATLHQVYFGTDEDAVKNAGTDSPEYKGSGSLGSESYVPGRLDWDTTYYWRIDEVNNAHADSPWTGPLWSFTTADFLIIDDMESYNDIDENEPGSNRIYLAWIDGYENPAINGAVVGYFGWDEQTIVHSGNQSMPFSYDNAVGKSEATLTLTSNRDWTVNNVNTLTIWHRGSSSNAAETMYVVLNGTAGVDNDNPNSSQVTTWTEWKIDLQAFADQGVNLANVNSITLGFGNRSNPVAGGTGRMYFDDIRLYRTDSQEQIP